MTSKRPPICPEHGLHLDQRVAWPDGRSGRLCARCGAKWKWMTPNPELDRVFHQTLDELFGKEEKPVVPMSDRALDAVVGSFD